MARPRKADAAPHATRKDTLRQAAYQLFRDRGYEATSVDAICEAAGASKGAFYWHYAAKQDVFVDILETWTQQVMDQMFAQFAVAVRSEDYVAKTTAALGRELKRGRAIVPLWLDFSVHARRDPALQESLGEFYQRARAAVRDMLRPVLGAALGEEGLSGVAAAIFGGYMGLLIQEMADPTGADAERAVAGLMALLANLRLPA